MAIDPSYCQALEEENEKLRKSLSEEQMVRDELEAHCKFFRSGAVVEVTSDDAWGSDGEDQTITIHLQGKSILKHPAVCDKVEAYRLSKQKYYEIACQKAEMQDKILRVLTWSTIFLAIVGFVFLGWWIIHWTFLFVS